VLLLVLLDKNPKQSQSGLKLVPLVNTLVRLPSALKPVKSVSN